MAELSLAILQWVLQELGRLRLPVPPQAALCLVQEPWQERPQGLFLEQLLR